MFSPSVFPVTVMQSRLSVPGFLAIVWRIAGTPPARSTSSMWWMPLGATLHTCGTRSATSFRWCRSNGVPASMAKASACRTVLVDPPMAMSSAKALSKAAGVRISRGRMFFLTSSTMALPAASNRASRFGSVARIVPFPGRASPSASARQFMEFAVNMPEHDPQVGQAFCFEGRQLLG